MSISIEVGISRISGYTLAKNTKERILKAALDRFNEMGYCNVRLQHIADEAHMSVGNMAYHFQHKTELFQKLYDNWSVKQDLIFADIHLAPIFKNFDVFLQQTFDLQQDYRFVYIDQLELARMSTEVKNNYQDYYRNLQVQLEIVFSLYEARGAISLTDITPQSLALRIRRIIDYWMLYRFVEGLEMTSFDDFRSSIWSEIQPYFTLSGREEYEELVSEFAL